jgi:hypothetical protein
MDPLSHSKESIENTSAKPILEETGWVEKKKARK